MKHKGGVPPVFRKSTQEERKTTVKKSVSQQLKEIQEKPRQRERSAVSQLYLKPKSPFTPPGPSTAGRRKTRKLKRRS